MSQSKRRAIDKSRYAESAAPQGRAASAVKLLTHTPSPDGAGLETEASWQEADPTQTMSVMDRDKDAMSPDDGALARGHGALPAGRERRDNGAAGEVLVAGRGEEPAPQASSGITPFIRLGISAFRGTRGTVAAIRQAIADARIEIDREEVAKPVAPPAAKPLPAPERDEARAEPAATARAASGSLDGAGPAEEPPPLEARPQGRPGRRDLLDRAPPGDRPAEAAEPTDAAPAQEQPAAPPPPRRIAVWEVLALLVLPVTVAALGAFATASLSEPVHAARSEIIFDLRRLDWSGAVRYLETQQVVVTGRTLLSPVAQSFDLSFLELERDLRVEKVGDSGVLRLEYRHPDPTLAQAVTKAITDRYLVVLREFERLEGTGHRLLTPAFVLEKPVSPQPLRAAAIGAVIGLALAAAGVVLRSHAWPTR
jgi:capsular polysaccharide biosynthesis protein